MTIIIHSNSGRIIIECIFLSVLIQRLNWSSIDSFSRRVSLWLQRSCDSFILISHEVIHDDMKPLIIMIDEYGEILRLKGRPGSTWSPNVSFRNPNAVSGDPKAEWQALDTTNTKGISFVARADIQGRALMVFYPSRPISWLTGSAWPNRLGFVR